MAASRIHRFEHSGKRFAVDTETCFCFECDAISWDVLEHYPHTSQSRIIHLLRDTHPEKDVIEVLSELDWLRTGKSILPATKLKELPQQFELTQGVHTFTAALPGARHGDALALAQQAFQLLLARSGVQTTLRLELILPDSPKAKDWEAPIRTFFTQAALADKQLCVALFRPVPAASIPEALRGHTLETVLELTGTEALPQALATYAKHGATLKGKWVGQLKALSTEITPKAVLIPGNGDLVTALSALEKLGFPVLEFDLDHLFINHSDITPEQAIEGLHQVARYYAHALIKHRYFRLNPFAEWFRRIYEGIPINRHDPAGVNAWAMDAAGNLYPARSFIGQAAYAFGNVKEGITDEDQLKSYEDLGALTTAPCMTCWAQHLCGGGTAAVHAALSGNYREPHPAWCNHQRALMELLIAAFNALSDAGVNFTRLYAQLERRTKPSLFTLVRAAFRMQLGLRPIAESDAPLLTQWEQWNEAAYFLFNETGLFMATQYDREMDSLHPLGLAQEFMLVRKNGTPAGLIKWRKERMPQTATVWVYLRDAREYAAKAIQKSFMALLQEAAGQQQIQQVLVPVGPGDTGLADFLKALGFSLAGTEREALYLHGEYHDVTLYSLRLDTATA